MALTAPIASLFLDESTAHYLLKHSERPASEHTEAAELSLQELVETKKQS